MFVDSSIMAMCADDQVLDDIYQYHLPPTRRVPPLLWTRLRGDLPGYLADSEADGVIVINWYHRQFRLPTITVQTVGDNNGIFLIAGKQPSCDTSLKRISFSISTTSCLNTSLAPTEEADPSPSNTLRSRDTGEGREVMIQMTELVPGSGSSPRRLRRTARCPRCRWCSAPGRRGR